MSNYPAVRNRLYPGIKQKLCLGPCGQVRSIEDFPANGRCPDGRMKRCRACMGLLRRKRTYTGGNLERRRTWEKNYYAMHRERELARNKACNVALRLEVISAYGSRCSCCDEHTVEFLTIDHVYSRSDKSRKELKVGGRALYLWLKRNGFPQDGYRLLCFNCNCARGHYGYCPHDKREQET